MKKVLIEIAWFIGVYLFMVIVKNVFFPIDNPVHYGTIDINIKDTYFIIRNLEVFISLLIIGYYCIYQIRSFILNYRNKTSNIILIIFQILSVVLISVLISFAFSLKNTAALSSGATVRINDIVSDINWKSIFHSLIIFQAIFSLILFYNSYRIFKKN